MILFHKVLRPTSERCFSEGSISYIAPRLLNRLPASMKESDPIVTFKFKLKTFSLHEHLI